MGIEWYRDLVICILGIITIATLIFISILVYSIYRRIKYLTNMGNSLGQKAESVLDNLESTTQNVQGIVAEVRETMSNPIAQICATFHGLRQGINIINKLFTKQEVKGDE